MKRRDVPPVSILTGPRGDGKSLFCRALAVHQGVAGVFSPACESAPGLRYGMDAVLIPGETRVPLARVTNPDMAGRYRAKGRSSAYTLVLPPEDDTFDRETLAAGIGLGPFTFSTLALSRVAAGLRDVARLDTTRLVIIDEIGPLELERSQGLMEPLVELLRGEGDLPPRPLLVVTRPSLVVALSQLVQRERPGCIPETVTTRDFSRPEDSRIIRALTS